MDIDRKELMNLFLVEADEQLELLEQEIMKLEQQGEASPSAVQSIFRAAHTLKGSSAAMGFERMKRLTHEMENVLDRIRNGKLAITNVVIDALLGCLDGLTRLKADIEIGQTEFSDIAGAIRLLAAIDRQTSNETAGSPTGGDTAASPPALPASHDVFRCELKLTEGCEMKIARLFVFKSQLEGVAELVGMEPDLMQAGEDACIESAVMYIRLKDALPALNEMFADWIASGYVEHVRLIDAGGKLTLEKMPRRTTEPAIGEPLSGPVAELVPRAQEETRRHGGHTIRVDVERLESLMNLVGELVIDQTRIAQVGTVLRDRYTDEALDDLEQVANHISRVVGDLQESVMKTRMLPIEQVFNRFPRMVRDLSQTLGKEVNLVLAGKETELDRTVIEEIADPLIHLVRNAVDHGIESAEERMRAGKPPKGTVHMRAHHQDNQVVLTIEDDGAGIDAERIKRSAIAKGVVTSQEADAMSDRELVHLIFQAGFSTAQQVSEVSGRGVGMDIVRSHIEKLNGLIDVETELGQGTKFTIKLPLTLAILRGLLIKLKETTYALPMSSVIEIVRLPRSEIDSIKGQTVIRIRDKVIPLAWLHDYFKLQRDERRSKNVFVVIVGVAEKRLGLVVDELTGNQEIVVKSIGSYVGKIEGISGATILGDGSVSLILDVSGLFRLVERDRPGAKEWEM